MNFPISTGAVTTGQKAGQMAAEQRGDQTFAAFSKKVGLPPSTIFRLERCEQSITLGRLDAVMKKLNVRWGMCLAYRIDPSVSTMGLPVKPVVLEYFHEWP